ncbi:class I SAM-dependent methyltransferase [Puia sp. P3]|uniref:class I SAM-dependent methyltransferase n=1 Tax=Puia sp. P3 TaxID=3423952 RepID=UPI003D669DA0
MDDKTHWETIYRTKASDQLSWTQTVPKTSLDFIEAFQLSRSARIIDIGGGDSHLVDFLLEEGFRDITVLDISEEALKRVRFRLGDKASSIRWLVSDITNFQPDVDYDLWHDRATFHFLTERSQVNRYLSVARATVHTDGYAVIGTFSENGPEKCSGLPIHQYTEQELTQELNIGFQKLKCITEDHLTPFNTLQNFLFCSFRRA